MKYKISIKDGGVRQYCLNNKTSHLVKLRFKKKKQFIG